MEEKIAMENAVRDQYCEKEGQQGTKNDQSINREDDRRKELEGAVDNSAKLHLQNGVQGDGVEYRKDLLGGGCVKISKKNQREAKERRLFGKVKQFVATICLGPIAMGCSISWTSPVLPQLQDVNATIYNSTFHLTTEEGSWVGSMLAVGSLAAAIPAGYLADRFGPKKCIIGFSIPVFIFTVIVCFAEGVISLCVARVFSGIATGGISVVAPMYICEIADVALRGTLSSFFELLIYLGIVLGAILGAYVHYITLTVSMGLLALVLTVAFLVFPESPTYLMRIKRREKAEKAFRFYRSDNFDCKCFLDDIEDGLASRAHKSKIGDILKSRAALRGLLACVGLTSFQQMSGIDGITFYTVQIFQKANAGVEAYTSSIIMAMVELCSAMVMVFISEKANRKTLLYISSAGACICLFFFGLYFTLDDYKITFPGMEMLPLTSMVLYTMAFALGLGPIPWMINGELFSPEIKGLANGITIATNWTLLFVITKTLPMMMEELGAHYTFYTYSIFMIACIAFVKFYVPETRGKTLEEIQTELKLKR